MCSFSQFSMPAQLSRDWSMNHCLGFSYTSSQLPSSKQLVSAFDFFFYSRVIHRFVPKISQVWNHWLTCIETYLIFKANFKNPGGGFVSPINLLAQKKFLAERVFNLKALNVVSAQCAANSLVKMAILSPPSKKKRKPHKVTVMEENQRKGHQQMKENCDFWLQQNRWVSLVNFSPWTTSKFEQGFLYSKEFR